MQLGGGDFMIPKKNPLDRLKESPYTRAASIVGIASILLIAGLGTIGQPKAALADKQKVEEFFGIGQFPGTRSAPTSEQISDCGDADPNTNLRRFMRTGENTFTGIIEGSTSKVDNRGLTNTCSIGRTHGTFRTLYYFESVTIAGKTGGAVIEHTGPFDITSGVIFTDGTKFQVLCGTGDLKGIHGEGITTASTGVANGYALWVHFGHNHDVGYDFLCGDLDDGSS